MKTPENKLGELLVQDSVISRPQLNYALHVQKGQARRERLGAILTGLGYITRGNLRDAVKGYGKQELFGEMLVRDKLISSELLAKALDRQKTSRKSLGSELVSLGALKEEELARALAEHCDVPYVVPQPHMVDMKVCGRLSEQFVLANSCIPISENHGVVTVLIADPTNEGLRRKLEDMFGCEVQWTVASHAKIKTLLEVLLLRKGVSSYAQAAGAGPLQGPGDRKLVIRSGEMRIQEEDSRTTGVLDYLVWDALRKGASDLHVEPKRLNTQVRYRIDGVLVTQSHLLTEATQLLFTRAKVLANLDTSTVAAPQEGRIAAEVDGEAVDLHVAMLRSVQGDAMVIHLFPRRTSLLDLDSLGMLPNVAEACRRTLEGPCGLTLYAGPKGTGKTTTLYSALQFLNDGTTKIVTLESPVAFALDGIVQHDISGTPDVDVRTMMSRLMEHDPDILAVGEIGDARGSEALLRCATTGHKVLSTLAADDAAAALVQLAHAEGAAAFLCSCSIAVLAQRLVRKLCKNCQEEYVPSAEIARGFGLEGFDADNMEFRKGKGCAECQGTGFRGRTGIFELVIVGPEIAALFHSKPSAEDFRSVMRKDPAFLSLEQAGFLKAVQGLTTLEEVRRVLPAFQTHTPGAPRRAFAELCRAAGVKPDRTLAGKNHELADRESPKTGG